MCQCRERTQRATTSGSHKVTAQSRQTSCATPPQPPPPKKHDTQSFRHPTGSAMPHFEHNIPARDREKQSAGLYNGSTYIKIYYNYARNCNCKMFPSHIISSQNTVVLYYLLCYIHPLHGLGFMGRGRGKVPYVWQGIYICGPCHLCNKKRAQYCHRATWDEDNYERKIISNKGG